MVEIFNFKKMTTITKLNTAITNLNVQGWNKEYRHVTG
jgi:hypothetical protein